MRNELIGNMRNMITGFLKNNRMEPSCAPDLDSTEGQRDGY